jgi:hypothetical protein
MRFIVQLFAMGWLMTPVLLSASEPKCEIRHSPDKKHLVAWFDQDVGQPLRDMRSVVLCASDDSTPLFSFVSIPRYTKAAWNPSSDRCLIADAPDNAGPVVWLLQKNSKGDWSPSLLEPFTSLATEFYNKQSEGKEPRSTLFRPSLLKIEWLTDTKIRFRGYCNLGTYLMTMDTASPDTAAKVEKLSDKLLEE